MLDELWPQLLDFTERAAEHSVVEIDRKTGDTTFFLVGNVRRRFTVAGQELRIRCDRLVLVVPRLAPERRGDEDPAAPRPADEFSLRADGNVRIEIPERKTVLEADSLDYDRRSSLAVIRGVRARTTLRELGRLVSTVDVAGLRREEPALRLWGEPEVPFVLHACELETSDLRTFTGEGLRVTTCDQGEPHYALAADAAVVRLVANGDPEAGAGGGFAFGGGTTHAVADLAAPRLELWGASVLPVPLEHWDTRWHDWVPVRDLPFGWSSKFGPYGGAVWNVNFFLAQLPLDEVPVVERYIEDSDLELGVETIYYDERGFRYGPVGQYGRRPSRWEPWQLRLDGWEHYGEARYVAIRDHGEDSFADAGEPPDPDRYWGSFVHRQDVPWLGTADVEYSERSDENFLGEYFERVFKEEKPQESLVSLRRNFTDNKAVTGLVKYRTDDFTTDVERLPEGRFWMLQEPLFGTGLYTDLVAQAAYLRVRPAEGSGLSSQRFARADVVNEWAYPVGWLHPWVQVRPYAFARYSAYEERADPAADSEDRFASGAGVVASQQWSRTFATAPGGWLRQNLGLESVHHLIVPRVGYENVFTNDLPAAETVQVDAVDRVDLREAVSVSLAQALFTQFRLRPAGGEPHKVKPLRGLRDLELVRSEHESFRLLDSDVRFVVFPHPGRDNGGDAVSLLVFDHTLQVHRRVALRSWVGLDPDDRLRGELLHNSVRAELWPDLLAVTVGEVYADDPGGGDDTNRVYTRLSVYPGEKWRAQLSWEFDLERGEDAEYSFALARVFHCFAFWFEYSFDAGEDDNHTVSVNLSPLGLLGGDVFKNPSRW